MNRINTLIEEMNIRGGGILQSIRQPDNKKLNHGDLVFVYPMIIDATLDRMYGEKVRNFISVSFMNRIKQSNVLNIISDAVSPTGVSSQGETINPALELSRHLGGNQQQEKQINFFGNTSNDDIFRNERYKNSIERLRDFIEDQIRNNPDFKDFSPIVGEVITSNLIPIPLILGTNKLKIDNNVLFWFLFIAAGQKIPLNRASSLDKIRILIRNIPADKYEEFMDKEINIGELDTPRKLQQVISQIWDGTDRALSRFHMVLDEKKWNEEVGVNNYNASLTTAMSNSPTSQTAMVRRASTTFEGFVSNEIIGILQSITHAIIPETEIDISSKLTRFVADVSDVKPLYATINDFILGSADSIDSIDELLKTALNICKENGQINVNQIFSQLSSMHFGVRGTNRKSGGFFSTGGNLLADFSEDMVKIGAVLTGYSKTLEGYINELGGVAAIKELHGKKNKFKGSIENFFRGGWKEGQGITAIDPGMVNNPNVIDLFRGGATPGEMSLFNSRRFLELTGQINAAGVITPVSGANQQAFEDNMYNSLTEIIYFLSLFSFLSFFCDYLREIETEVSVQKRDAVSFPNYTLVIKKDYITRLFWALSIRNFENEITSKDEDKEDPNYIRLSNEIKTLEEKANKETSDYQKSLIIKKIVEKEKEREKLTAKKGIQIDQFRVSSMGDFTKQVKLIKERLGIPNLVVVDEPARKIYYMFMFMERVMNLELSTVEAYIDSQKNINLSRNN